MSDSEPDDTFLARWLSNELSDEERVEFESSAEFADYTRIVNGMDQLEPSAYDEVAEFDRLKEKIDTPVRTLRQPAFMRWGIAASFALVVSLASYFLLFSESGEVMVVTAAGQKEIIELPDGSTVKLNAGSEVSYLADEWDNERTLQLKGEAFFQVKKGSDFQVVTPSGTVTVLGTSFNVRSRGAGTEVICYTGKVRVELDTVFAVLLPGDAIRVAGGQGPVRWEIDDDTEAKWISGVVDLFDVPLTDALHELEVTYGTTADFSNITAIDTIRFSGTFPMDNPDVAIEMILEPFDLKGTFDANKKTLTVDYK
jgi:transmembrane sensor